MGLEIGGLVGDQGVSGRVGFIEPVSRKGLHLIKYPSRLLWIDAVLLGPLNEMFPLPPPSPLGLFFPMARRRISAPPME